MIYNLFEPLPVDFLVKSFFQELYEAPHIFFIIIEGVFIAPIRGVEKEHRGTRQMAYSLIGGNVGVAGMRPGNDCRGFGGLPQHVGSRRQLDGRAVF